MSRGKAVTFVLVFALCLAGCQTPERREVRLRMDRLQAENSALKAKAESEVAGARMEIARQRQDDIRMIEAINRRFDELNKKIESIASQPRAEKPPQTPVAPTEPAKPDPAVQAELERVREQARAEMKRLEEELAKAQAQEEAAKLAAIATEKTQETKKESSFKGQKLPLTKFIDSNGKLMDIAQYAGQKPVVLTVMKGFYSQGICVYCTRQTGDLARNAKAFQEANAEVFVVYPGKDEHINAFVRSVRDYEKSDDPRFQLPFKVLLDVNQDAVKVLNIAGDLAHPTSFVIDKNGVIQFQYVGRTMSDRPTAAALLQEVKKLGDAKP